MRKKSIKIMFAAALAAGAVGAYAQTAANAATDGGFVLQGDFADGSPTVLLNDNSNRDRVGAGGNPQRINQQLMGFALPAIPAGETLTQATFSFQMAADALNSEPLQFEMVICLMNATSDTDFTTDDFVTTSAPINAALGNGIVIGQLADTDVSNGATMDIALTGAALSQLAGLYDGTGNPSQSHVWFRLSTSEPAVYPAFSNDRFQLEDNNNTGPVVRSLKLSWAPVPEFIADPVVKANVTWGTDYATLSQTLAGSATNSAGSTTSYEKTGGPDWLVVATDGALSGIADMVGTNEFPIKAIIGENFATATLQIVVDPLGNAPEFTVDPIVKADAAYNEDYALKAQTLDGSATDLDGDTLIYSKLSGPGWLNVASNGTLSGVCDVLGTNTFSVGVDDGNGNSDTAVLEIFVPQIGSAPEFTVDPIVKADGEFDVDYALESQTLEGSATDPDGDTLIYSKTGGPAWLNVASNGVLSGVCAEVGTNSFTVSVDDGNGNSDSATLLIYVAPPPQPEILVGWERWTTGTSPATVQSNGFTGVADSTGWTISRFAACNDGTFGTLLDPPASADTSVNEEGIRVQGAEGAVVEFTIENTSGSDVDLGIFHFDAVNKTTPDGPDTFSLEVLAGSGITVGEIITTNLAYIASGGDLADYDIDLTGLADHTLEAGGVVTFRLTFSGGLAGANSRLDVDNAALTKVLEIGPVEPPVMGTEVSGGNMTITWTSDGSFKLQSRESLTIGDWVDVPGGTTSPVVVPATKDVEFLRLIEQ